MKQFNDVDSRRGAPMGRREFVENPEVTVNLFRVRMVDGDYDDGGAYWGGHSEPLWCARNPDEGVQLFVRANSQQEAKEQILDDWPHLQFDTYSLTNRATLDEMIEGYLDAAKFTDAPEGSRARFTRAAILKAEAVCLEFAQVCGGLADQAINLPGYGAYQLGFDFWLDRSGSGSGFTDERKLAVIPDLQAVAVDRNGEFYTVSALDLADALSEIAHGTSSHISKFAYPTLTAYGGWLHFG